MKKKVTSILLAVCMLVSMLPTAAFAVEADPVYTESLTLPVVSEGEQLPKPQGYGGGVSLFSLIPNSTDYTYAYEGVSNVTLSVNNGYLTFPVPEGVTPTDGGVMQVVDENGKVLAGSQTISYDEDYDDETVNVWRTWGVSFNDESADANHRFADIPAGEYTLQVAVGEERYTVHQKLCVVDKESLLIDEAEINLYYDDQSAEIRMEIYGLESEADLSKMSLTLTDPDGEVIARSTGAYRDFQYYNYYGYWYFYMELAVESGKELVRNTPYNLTISDTSQRTLVDGVGGVTGYAQEHSAELGDIYFSDAQNGVLTVELLYPRAGTTYDVQITEDREGNVVYGSWTGTVPEDGLIEIPLTLNGTEAAAADYPYSFYVGWKTSSNTWWNRQHTENPYANNYSGDASFQPYNIGASVRKQTFMVELNDFAAYRGDGTDVLTMCDRDGKQVASCSSFEEVWNGSYTELYGTLNLPADLKEGRYYLFLNGVEFDNVRVTTDLSQSFSYSYVDWDNASETNTFWTNFGEWPFEIESINSTGSARLELRDAAGNVVASSGTMAASEGEFTGYVRHTGSLKQKDLASYAGTELYMWFVDSANEHERGNIYVYDDTVSDIAFQTSGGGDNYTVHPYWGNLESGDTDLEVYFHHDNFRNVTEDMLMGRLGDLRLECGDTILTVDSFTKSDVLDGEHMIALSAPITPGDWIVYDGSKQLYEFDVTAPGSEDSYPHISSDINTDGWYVRAYNLPMDNEYTAMLYKDYTTVTEEPFELTLYTDEEGDQRLRIPKSVITGLTRGEYELRVYMNGALLGGADMTIVGALQPSITVRDNYGNGTGDRVFHGRYLYLDVTGGGSSWQYCRMAEADLEKAEWWPIDYSYELTDMETLGARTLYIQLAADEDGTNASDVIEYPFLYLGNRSDNNLIDIFVHEEVEGLYNGDTVTLGLGAEYPYAHAMVDLVDGDGSKECVKLTYQGEGKLPNLSKPVVEGEVIASPHPYTTYMDKTWSYTLPGAESIEVTFSEETMTESSYDYIHVYYVEDGVDVLYGSPYCGSALAGQTLTLPGDTVKVRLTSDGSGEYYGFTVTSVVDPNAVVEDEEDTTPTYHIYSAKLNTADYIGTEKLYFYLVQDMDDDNGYRNTLISEVVERSLIFGDPTAVILPQFPDEDKNYVLTNQNDFTIYGYGIPGSTVTLTYPVKDGDDVVLGTATAAANGKFTIELTDLEDGLYGFTATSETADAVIYGYGELEVDTTAPSIDAMGFAFSDSDTATLNWTCTDSDLYRSIVYLLTETGEQRLGYVYTNDGEDGVFSKTVTATSNDGQQFKVVVEDNAGNKASRTISTSDQEPPIAPTELAFTDRTASTVTLQWNDGEDNVGVAGYTIYKNGEKIAQTTGETALSYTVTELEQGTEYTFSVATRDLAGNLSVEANPNLTVSTAKLSVDATIPGTVTTNGSDTVAIKVLAALSSDVAEYVPSMKNLFIRYQEKDANAAPEEDKWVSHSLSSLSLSGSEGKGTWNFSLPTNAQLPLNYWIQVVAADGENVTAYSETQSLSLVDGRVTFTVKDGKTGNVIPNANVAVYQDGELALSGNTDAEGKVLLGLADGSYSLMATADGYQMRSISSLTISADRLEFTIYMNSEDILKVETTVKEMTYDEIVAAGIDPAAAGNQQVYQCTAILDFVPITYVCAGDQVIKADPVKVGDHIVYPAARDIFLIVPTQTTWLKEMFDVQLLVTNSSAFEDVENCVATLDLPTGLSLADMATGIQSLTAEMGTIVPGGSASHHWYVRGDAEGDYTLQGTVTGQRVGGGISEDISIGFATKDPISVLAGSAMKLTIEAERFATIGQPYNMRFTLKNVSNKSLYNVNFDVLGGTFRQEYTIEDVLASYDLEGPFKSDADNSNLKNGFVLSAAEFKPADALSGVFTITFGQGISDPDGVKYMLERVFLFTGAGSTTEIPTEIIWVDSVDHAHSYDDGKVTKEPTCTEDGEKTYTCTDADCGDTFTVAIPATGHSMGAWTTIKAATCTEAGSAESSCTKCSYKETMTLNALGHSYAEEWTTDLEPTCTDEGSKSRHCIRCGDKADITVIPALGHSFGDWEKHDATQHKRTCSVETCKFVEYADHTWNEGEVTTDPTHLTEGVKTYTCTTEGCGETKTESVNKLPDHEWGDWEKISDTQHQRKCPCEETETADHEWSDGEMTKEPTLTEEGEKTYTCAVCNGTKTESLPKLQKQDMIFATNLVNKDMLKTYGDPKFIDMLYNESVEEPNLTFASSDEKVATVDEDGYVTIKGAGETIISATSAAVPYQYVETTASYKLIVSKAALTITANDVSAVYGQVFIPNGYTAEGFVYDETMSVLAGEIAYSTDYEQYAKAGEYAVNVGGVTSDNYDITFVPGKLTVAKADSYTVTFGNLSQKSDAVTPVTVTVEPQDESAEISLEYKVNGSWTSALPTAVGTYPVRAQLTASDNIVLDDKIYGDQLVIEAVDSIGGISVSVKTDDAKEEASVEVTDEEVAEIVEKLEDTSGDLAVNLESVTKDTLVLPGNLIEELDKSEDLNSVTVTTEKSSIAMSDAVVETMADAMTREDTVSLEMKTVKAEELEPEQQTALESIGGPSPKAVLVELKLVVKDSEGNVKKEIQNLGGKVDITIQCDDEMKGKRVVACYISPDGTVTYLVAKYDEATNSLNFKTDHFSAYGAVVLNENSNVVFVVDEDGKEQSAVGAGPQTVGATVTIEAPAAPSGYRFSSWQVVEGTVTLTNATSASTTFTMPDEDVVLKAIYTRKSSGSSGSYTPTYGVTLDKTSNGTVTLSSKYAAKGSTVTITIEPDKGYELDKLVVLDKNNDEVKMTKKSDTKYSFTMPSGKVTVKATFVAIVGEQVDSENPFVDVKSSDWFYNPVLWAVENGVTAGTSANTFSPGAACTRAQAVTFLWNANGSPEPKSTTNPFTDVSEKDWFYKPLMWAIENGVTAGTSATTFSPNATCTRAQIVTFMWNAEGVPAVDTANPFSDIASGNWFNKPVLWAVENKVTAGTSNTTFSPDATCTRAQIVTFLFNHMGK